MTPHWTERSNEDFLFRIAADFITQLEDKMESLPMSQDELAQRLNVTKGRVSQILNNPGNITLSKIVKCARTLGLKVSIVAYEDNDPNNENGPINSEVFSICWEKSGKPRDFWAFQEIVSTSSNVQKNINILTAAANEVIRTLTSGKAEIASPVRYPPYIALAT
ncbi:MAG: helix-turn-helix transcriptional regulator [Candidatus Desulfaltia sp.]|nr:helix-turn-helix transcriptional regulator [Candidatus Desulfaltia sp.]